MVVLVLVAGKGAVDATADRFQEGAFTGVGGASFVADSGTCLHEPDAPAQLVHGEQPVVAGELTRRWLRDERMTEEFLGS
jgi:hypothetical protein